MSHDNIKENIVTKQPGICYLVGALPWEQEFTPTLRPEDYLIAADGGYTTCQSLGLTPNLVVGDFDSLPQPPEFPNVLRLPRIKDETDIGFALTQGETLGYRRFLLLGCMGGRPDHTFANYQLLAGLAKRDSIGILVGEGHCATALFEAGISFPSPGSGRISVFSQGDTCVVSLAGLKYPLEQETLTAQFPLGVSNEFLDLPAQVTVHQGTALVIWERCCGLSALGDFLRISPT